MILNCDATTISNINLRFIYYLAFLQGSRVATHDLMRVVDTFVMDNDYRNETDFDLVRESMGFGVA